LVFALWPSGSTSSGGTPQALTALTNTPLHATASVTGVSWGTRISLDCQYGTGQGGQPGAMYALMVVAKDGSRHSLGTWTVVTGHHTQFTSGTALPDSSLKTIEITNSSGKA